MDFFLCSFTPAGLPGSGSNSARGRIPGDISWFLRHSLPWGVRSGPSATSFSTLILSTFRPLKPGL